MGKKRRILFAILAVAMLGALAWMVLSPRTEPEPVYQGKSLSAWLEYYDPLNTNRLFAPQMDPAERATQTAIRQMGTNAIPTMLQMLRTPDLPWKIRLFALARKQHFIKITYVEPWRTYEKAATGLEVLGPRATGAVPELVRIFDQNPSPRSQAAIARAFTAIGPGAKLAVPSLLRGATGTNDGLRYTSLLAFSQIQAEPNLVVPVFINALQDPDPDNRYEAAWGLGAFGTNARAAVPALVKFIESKDPSITSNVKEAARQSLQDIDPEAAAKLSTNLDRNAK